MRSAPTSRSAIQELRWPTASFRRSLSRVVSPRRCRGGRASLPTTVDSAGVSRHPAEVEAAVYFCCLEALQNAGKHAGDEATASVRVWEDDTLLGFEVTDDGAGFDPAGAGKAAMAS